MRTSLTRRDFINGALIGSGTALLASPAPAQLAHQAGNNDWTGYGGVGDYRNANGNTWDVVTAAHKIRDGAFSDPSRLVARDTGEIYDLVVVGGGSAGLGAAYFFQKLNPEPSRKCLVFENHAIFGGEARQNEFVVNGQRLIGPQGAWRMVPEPSESTGWMRELYSDVNLLSPRFQYQQWDPSLARISHRKNTTCWW